MKSVLGHLQPAPWGPPMQGEWPPGDSHHFETRMAPFHEPSPLTPPARPKPLRRGEGPSLPPTVSSAAMTQVGGREIGRGAIAWVQGFDAGSPGGDNSLPAPFIPEGTRGAGRGGLPCSKRELLIHIESSLRGGERRGSLGGLS